MIHLAAAFVVATSLSVSNLVAAPGFVDDVAPVEVASEVDAVVLYEFGADVRRTASVTLEPGIHELVFVGIPDPNNDGLDGVRASVDPPFAVLGVDVTQQQMPVVADAGSLRAAVAEATVALRRVELERQGVDRDLAFIDSIGVRAASDATEAGGTAGLDLEAVERQLQFVRAERTRLQAELLDAMRRAEEAAATLERAKRDLARSGEVTSRTVATVRVAAPEAGDADVSIRYLRSGAGWSPSYAIRSTEGEAVMPLEYEAIVRQATGEDWNDVAMTLSTATPSMPSGPAEIRPVFVDRRRDEPAAAWNSAAPMPKADTAVDALAFSGEGAFGNAEAGRAMRKAAAIDAMRNASVSSGGTAVTYVLPRSVSVPSDTERTARLRIADIAATASRVLVARPIVDEQVYLRGDLVNDSPFVLLGGDASLFMEGEYIGPTTVAEVPAGGDFEVWFGVDPSITVERRVLKRETEKTGLLGGGRQTSIEYRVDLRNDGDTPATVELWDRRPVSRDGDIEVRVVNADPPLATDQAYLDTDAKLGLMKWTIDLAPGAERAVTWTVRVNRSSDLEITPIPE